MTSATASADNADAWPGAYLERIDTEQRMARFYLIHIQRTLFGEWAVIYQWGRIGTRGQRREYWLATWPEARDVCNQQLTRKMRRGYALLRPAFDSLQPS